LAENSFDYPLTNHDPAEQAFRDYEHERWVENPESWSPLINLEQLAARPNLEVEFYVPDFIPVGAKTIISGEPKCGKSIALLHMLKAAVEGGKFLGKSCPPTRVLMLSECTEMEFKRQVAEVPGLLGNKNFYVLLPEEAPQTMRTWEDTIEFADKMLALTKSKILVIDTFGSLAKLPPGGENDSSTVQNTINRLNFLFKNRYLSVVLTHHNRKKSEDRINPGSNLAVSSARGSSAFVGGAGHLIFMNAIDKSTKRQFTFYGRYLNGVERSLYLDHGEYKEIPFSNFGGQR
jgi:archaellum biogenesis ATPase FlaH